MGNPTSRRLAILPAFVLLGVACTSPVERVEVAHIHGLGVDPAAPDTVFVATHFGLHVHEDGEWAQRSEDIADHMGFTLISSELMFRSGHPSLEMRDEDPALGTNLGVQRSTDGGRTWETITPEMDQPYDFHAMTATHGDPPVIIGGDSGGRGVVRSPDGGETWEAVEAGGLPDQVGAFTVSPDGSKLYASTEAGLLRSDDLGEGWEPVSPEPLFALAAAGEGLLYASRESTVLRSSDGGESWDATGPDGSSLIVALTCTPDGQTVVAADRDNVVWRSDDGGGSWAALPEP